MLQQASKQMPSWQADLQDAEGPQLVGQLLCIELLTLAALQDGACEGCHHFGCLMHKGGICPHDIGDVLG